MQQELADLPSMVEDVKERIAACEKDILLYAERKRELSPEEKEEYRLRLDKAVQANRGVTEEVFVMEYFGFRIVIPAYMSMYHYSLDVIGNGKYRLPCNSEEGHLRRLDSFLEGLNGYLAGLGEKLKNFAAQKRALQKELQKTETYGETIEALQEELEKIDKELGIKDDE